MNRRKTPLEIFNERPASLPSPGMYNFFLAYGRICARSIHAKFVYHFDTEEMKGKQVILIGDHNNCDTPLYTMTGYPFARLSVVLTYQDLFQKFLFRPMMKLGVIPKRQFTPDLHAMRQMLQIVRLGGSLCFFPEGMASFSGSTYAINPSTVDLLKSLGLTVVLCKTYGGFCAMPFWRTSMAQGPQEFHYEILYTPEELKEKSMDALYRKLMERIRYRDFEWAAEHGYTYRRRGVSNAAGVDKLLYLCPQCGREFTLRVEKDTICCTECGNRIHMDGSFTLHPEDGNSASPFRNPDEWFKAQRRKMREDVKNPDFSLSYECTLSDAHTDQLRLLQFYQVGEGIVTIDRKGVHYDGTRRGEKVSLDFDIRQLPTFMVNTKLSYLYQVERQVFNSLYYHNESFYFRPKKDINRMIQYQLAVEELHNLVDPAWNKAFRDANEDEIYTSDREYAPGV